MPTNRNRRQRTSNKLIVPPALIYMFQTGDQDQTDFPETERYNEFLIFGGGVGPQIEDYWQICREKVIAEWIKEKPLTRPFAFWCFDFNHTVFGFRVPSENDQLTYLIDHDLLTAAEKAYLKKHPELLEPETGKF